ncbi:putative solute-binding protein, partial [Oleiphilus sp. HI0125]
MNTATKTTIFIFCALFSVQSFALEKKKYCLWDPVGKTGPVVEFFSDLKPKALGWGLDLEFITYTDEKVASNDFKAGLCDAVHLTAILSRNYVPFAGSLDAIGGILSDDELDRVLVTLANPKAGKLMTNGKYEVVASFPVGSMFAFVNDKNIDTVAEFSGKKISVLNEDPQALQLSSLAGASPVGTSLATFSGQFNNGNIDILLMPALAYNT